MAPGEPVGGLLDVPRKSNNWRLHDTLPDCVLVELTHGQVAVIDAEYLAYVCTAGSPVWRAHWDRCTESYYAVRTVRVGQKRTVEFMHRVVATLAGIAPHLQVDHRKHVTLDNRKSQLRGSTRAQNHMNQLVRSDSAVQLKGVGFARTMRSRPFRATIRLQGKSQHIGYYATAEEAHEAYVKRAAELFGTFAHDGQGKGMLQ